MNIVFQGEKGSFSEAMASIMFSEDVVLISCKTFKEVFDSVDCGKADIGVVPVENSTTGKICEVTDLLISSDVNVCREGFLRINHCLIVNKDVLLKNIKQIYAHPEALLQCKSFLRELNCELISWYDGAAASEIIKKKSDTGLIASKNVADIYNLKILKEEIQDSKENTTRFFIISKKSVSSTGNDKTSVIFYTQHKPGLLYHALECFAKEKINLTRIESMPLKEKPWNYLFLIEFLGHRDDLNVKKALQDFKKNVISMKILGSYPCGSIY